MTPLYLDNNATQPLRPEARAALLCVLEACGNASSPHAFGRAQRKVLEGARAEIARLVGAKPAEVIFTSGASEANNAVLKQTNWRSLIVGAGEHPSVLAAAPGAVKVPLDSSGLINLAALEQALSAAEKPVLLSLQAANNETAVIQPLDDVARLVKAAGAFLHIDAVQAIGRIPLDFAALGAHYLSLSAHKLGGPQGVGALLVKEGAPFHAFISGGGQEMRRRAGTENIAGAAAFAAAAKVAVGELDLMKQVAGWRDELAAKLKERHPGLMVFGETAPRLAGTLCFALPGTRAETLLMALDLEGVAVSSGSACSSGKVEPSHVLSAMGFAPDLALAALRLSFGWANAAGDVERFLVSWDKVIQRLAPKGNAA